MAQDGRYMIFLERPYLFILAAALGVAVNFLTLMVIQATSSVTVKILNTVRCIALVAVGAVIYGEQHSSRQLFGYAVSLVGFVGYNFFERRPTRAAELEVWVHDRLARTSRTLATKSFLDASGGTGNSRSPSKKAGLDVNSDVGAVTQSSG